MLTTDGVSFSARSANDGNPCFAVAQRCFVSLQRTVESIKFGVGAGRVIPDFNGGFVALSAGNLCLFFSFGDDYGSLFVCLGADLLSLLLSLCAKLFGVSFALGFHAGVNRLQNLNRQVSPADADVGDAYADLRGIDFNRVADVAHNFGSLL